MKKSNLKKAIFSLTCLLMFALPWQTRWQYAPATINGNFWEYGSESLYGTELLLGVIIILLLIYFFRNAELRKNIWSGEFFFKRKKLLYYYIVTLLYFVLEIVMSQSWRMSLNWTIHLVEAVGVAGVVIVMRASIPSPYEGEVSAEADGGVGDVTTTPFPLLRKEGVTNRSAFVASFWLGGVVQALLALYQFFVQQVDANKWLGLAFHSAKQLGDYALEVGDQRWLRAYGSFGSPNILGGFLAVCWLLGLILYLSLLKAEKYRAALLVTIGNMVVLSGLIVSFSRSAWIGAVAGLATILTVIWAHSRAPLRQLAKQIVFSIAVILIFFFSLHPLFTARALSEGRLEAKSINERTTQYTQALTIIKHHWLFGVGPGAYTFELAKQNPKAPVWELQPVHNMFVLALAETGIVGVLFVVLLYYYITKLLWQENKFFLSILISIFVTSVFDHYWWSLYSGIILFGALLGIIMSSARVFRLPREA